MQYPELKPKPAAEFETWNHATLARFASAATLEIVSLRAAVDQLRTDLRDAMTMMREMRNARKED